ncbi:hypothetical protein PLEOSDRAFT_163022 [Pleurotus ostreatus PC15]|uniref:Uncharacterized protein n=1 Tax=Pleurotus ostreatus (strain PC15) TaxID=1137138 RepID=A0A067NE91_PLEO1|nr:hypothetical protein PLEOSDRAFT_163022 [Pleurotus ostreatus PC15]
MFDGCRSLAWESTVHENVTDWSCPYELQLTIVNFRAICHLGKEASGAEPSTNLLRMP